MENPAIDSDSLRLSIIPLDLKKHNRSAFQSASEPLDTWFKTQAGQQTRKNVTRVFVCIDSKSETIVGFYTLSAAMLTHAEVEGAKNLNAPKYPDLPVVLLGRLAVDARFQSLKLGSLLLLNAINRCDQISENLGFIGVVVDAKDSRAASFYLHHNFIHLPDTENRLILPLAHFAK